MAVTLKQIAELAGVSRGTVDRALYDRGRVNEDVAKRIKKIANELGYQPNRAGRALAYSKNPAKIGVIVQAVETPFMRTVIGGISKATSEIKDLGIQVIVKELECFSEDTVIETIDELVESGISGLALIPTDGEKLRLKLNEIIDINKIPVVTFNSDISDCERVCFVGLDNYKSGEACAGIMSDITGSGKILIITGYDSHQSHNQRVTGFCDEIKNYINYEVLPIEMCYDNDMLAEKIVLTKLSENKDIVGVFVPSNGQLGVCKAIREMNLKGKVKVICYDLIPSNIKELKDGGINFLIDQDGFEQGYRPLIILSDYFLSDAKPEKEQYFTNIVIKNRYIV